MAGRIGSTVQSPWVASVYTRPMLLGRIRRGRQTKHDFSHEDAQLFEAAFARKTIEADFPELWQRWQRDVADGSLWHGADDQWFGGDAALWGEFVEHVRPRKALEIGSGPFGYLGPCWWIADRVIVDPLVDVYRQEELRVAGGTFFDDGVKTFAQPAELLVPELVGAVDGAIVCRNALDHTEDPLRILWNIGEYAAPGCWLLFWTDIWHLAGLDDGHRNITRQPGVLDSLLTGLGFEIVKNGRQIRDEREYLEYGRLARRR
jgi:hypothetical protein